MHPVRPKIRLKASLFCLLVCWAGNALADEAQDLQILGWVEYAWLTDPVIKLQAKLDTGADTSSLHAWVVKAFRRGGKRYVRFEVEDPSTGKRTTMERERVRTVGIVQHYGERDRRPVVAMTVCVSGQMMDMQVSLTDRGNFTYPLLIGRRALERLAMVDPSNSFLGNDECEAMVAKTPPAETP